MDGNTTPLEPPPSTLLRLALEAVGEERGFHPPETGPTARSIRSGCARAELRLVVLHEGLVCPWSVLKQFRDLQNAVRPPLNLRDEVRIRKRL